jgi:hypothetical protein
MPQITPEQLLGPPQTADYQPTGYWHYGVLWRFPRFTLMHVHRMLAEPRICFGLHLIKGPILAVSRFYVDTENMDVKDYITDAYGRFWNEGAVKALKAIEWGYSCSEVFYKLDHLNRITYDCMKDLMPTDCRAYTRRGRFYCALVRGTKTTLSGVPRNISWLYGMKAFWHVHNRVFHPWYGRSRLFGCFIPWMEHSSDGGYRDSRRLYQHKFAYDGGVIYHPPGTINTVSEGGVPIQVSAKDYARELLEKKKTGGVLTLPNTLMENGQARQWEYIPPQITAAPSAVLEYGISLRDEILEGMGIPPEMARPEATGPMGGGNGRGVAQNAFFSILQEIVNTLTDDFDQQILRPLVKFHFGDVRYRLIPWRLVDLLDRTGTPTMPAFPAPQVGPTGGFGFSSSGLFTEEKPPE